MAGGAGVGSVQVLEENHLLFEATASEHAGWPATVAGPGTVRQTGANAAEPAEVVQTGRGSSPDQLDRSSWVLSDKTLRGNHRNSVNQKNRVYHRDSRNHINSRN